MSKAAEGSWKADKGTVEACLAKVQELPAGNAWEQGLKERVVAALEEMKK